MPPPYLQLPSGNSFDHQFLLDALRSYRSPRDKIALMLEHGEIIRIRKGLYIRSPQYGGTAQPVEIANALYGPSYVSLEYALSHYNMIPERVEAITSVTSKRTRRYLTPFAAFYYAHIPAKAHAVGVDLDTSGPVGVLIATREKAVCDKLALASHIRTIKEIGEYIIEDQRMDEDEIAHLSLDRLREIQSAYCMQRIDLFVRWFERNHGERTPSQ